MSGDALMIRVAMMIEITYLKSKLSGQLGKTAMQKLLYLLQAVYGVDLGYRFAMYTYGPYDAEVMSDLDYADAIELLKIESDSGYGYEIKLGASANAMDDYRSEIRKDASEGLEKLFDQFGNMNASDLELYATLVFVAKDNAQSDRDSIVKLTNELKKKFPVDIIEKYYLQLCDWGILTPVAA